MIAEAIHPLNCVDLIKYWSMEYSAATAGPEYYQVLSGLRFKVAGLIQIYYQSSTHDVQKIYLGISLRQA